MEHIPDTTDTHITHGITREEYVEQFNLELEAQLASGIKPIHDPFATEDTSDQGYERSKFYVETVRKKREGGNPKNLQVPIEPVDYEIMSQILHQRLVPQYNTLQDLVRDAIHHRLHDLTHGDFKDGLKIYLTDQKFVEYDAKRRIMIEIADNARQIKEETLAVEQLNEGLQGAANNGNRQHVYQLLEHAQELLGKQLGDYNRETITQLVHAYKEWLEWANRGGLKVQTNRITPNLPGR